MAVANPLPEPASLIKRNWMENFVRLSTWTDRSKSQAGRIMPGQRYGTPAVNYQARPGVPHRKTIVMLAEQTLNNGVQRPGCVAEPLEVLLAQAQISERRTVNMNNH
ncbi:MAG: hypothetical protein M1823_003894 [Watsoniomyces obsoletus]|nr:MAG: hypothetical protein M1823_003894 [Watsoniomyces obsoletus]